MMHEWITVEFIEQSMVAYYESQYPVDDITNKVDIGPLFELFSNSGIKTCAEETGVKATREDMNLWMGPTRFHLPPTIRWICQLDLENNLIKKDSLEMWMVYSNRVHLANYSKVRKWAGGYYAFIESGFDCTVSTSWLKLNELLENHKITAIGGSVLIENMQAISHGGWDRYRIMIEVDGNELKSRGWAI